MALVHDAGTTAVMMATPADLEDFAVGFSMTEGIVAEMADIAGIEVVEAQGGIEARIWLAAARSAQLSERRRSMAGPTGCGLCGVESLAAAGRMPPRVSGNLRIGPADIDAALSALSQSQHLGVTTRAVHAAGLWTADGLALIREDVGRHNALDKLVGSAARAGIPARAAAVVLTSRVSIEMVQKTAIFGAPVLIAVSAPTALAVRTAEACGITLIAVARADGFEVFSHPERLAI